MSSGNFGCWAMKAGDFRATEFAGDAAGLADAITYAASGTGGDGLVSVFNSTTTPVAIPNTIPAGVQVEVNEGGLRKVYSSGCKFPASGAGPAGTQPIGNPTSYHYHPVWANVREFGAKGDGVTDDQAAIMAAYNALPPTGGIIFFPNGDYLINSTLDLTKTVILEGTSHNNVENTPAPCRILKGNYNGAGMILSGACSQMRRINFQGLADNIGIGIQIKNNSCSLEDVMVSGMGGTGIVLGAIGASVIMNINHWQMTRVISRHNFGDGVHMEAFDSQGGANCNAGTAINLSCYQNNSKGLRLVKAGKNTFIGLTCESNGQEGLYLEDSADSNVFIGGDQEANNGGLNATQVRVADAGCDDNVFFHVGILSTHSVPADLYPAGGASRSQYYSPLKHSMPRVVDSTGEAISNGPAGSNDLGNVPYFQSFWNNSDERLRVGYHYDSTNTTPPDPGTTATQITVNLNDSTLNLLSRKVSSGKIKLWAGSSFERYLLLDQSVLTTNAQLDVVGGAEIRVGGTRVVGARGAAVADALTEGSATAADCAAQLNLLLARIRAHGLIAT